MSREHSPESRESITRFGKLLAELARSGVDFAVVGGLAVIFNGYDRLTLDADILVSLKAENIQKLLQRLGQWGEGFARELKVEDFVSQEGSIRVIEEFELDIFTQMQGKTLEDFRPRLRQLRIEDVSISYISPEDLIALKKDSWRDKDKLDVAAMAEILKREGETKANLN
ncbi:MAG: nucleotidyltransferase [Limisphaerales bacterium]